MLNDRQVDAYVNQLGRRIASVTSRGRELDWQFAVVNSDEVNAFALPGGYIYVNRGVLQRASTMDELQTFYDVAFPLLEQHTDYLEAMSLDGISEQDRNLLYAFEALVTVSFPVEVWRQPKVPDAGASSIDVTVEPVP